MQRLNTAKIRATSFPSLVCALICSSACGLSSGGGNQGRPDTGPQDAGEDASQRDAAGDSCLTSLDCVVAPRSCCGTCGGATRGDAVAVSLGRLSQQREEACAESVGCDACVQPNDPELVATCDQGECVLVDLDTRPEISSCDVPEDCKLRFAGCCECANADTTPILAIHVGADDAYRALTCAPSQGCPECEPTFPGSVLAGCDGTQRCRAFPIED